MKCSLIVIFFITGLQISFSQSVRSRETIFPSDSLSNARHDSILHYLELGKIIVCGGIGIIPSEVRNFKRFIEYASFYSIDTLKKYLDKGNNQTLRIYSAWALLKREVNSLEYLTSDLLKDTSMAYYYCGCIAGQDFSVKQFVYLLFSGKIDLSVKPLADKSLRYIRRTYNPGASKVMQPCRSGELLKLKAF